MGLLITSADSAYEQPYLWPPVGAWGALNPQVWGDLTSEQNWIPEFPAVILPLLMVFSGIALIHAKMRLKKAET